MQQYGEWQGTIGKTLADSQPWFPEPPHPGEDAPNVVIVLLDDLRFRTTRLLRVRHRHPQHRCARRQRPPLHQLPRHPAVLTDPGRPAHRTQPPHRRDAGRVELQHRLPQHDRTHLQPRRNPRRGAPRRGLRNLRRRQMAPHADGGDQCGRALRPVAAAAWLRPLLRIPRGRDRPVQPRPHLRQPPHRPPGEARRRLPRERGPHRPRHRVRARHQERAARQALLLVCGLRGHPCPASVAARIPLEISGPLRRRLGCRAGAVVRQPARHGGRASGDRSGTAQPWGGGLG